MSNPFNQGTKQAEVFDILSDMKWHCGKHELPGTQPAKNIQIMRQHGYTVENDTRMCGKCGYRTVHRRLVSTTPTCHSRIREPLPPGVRERVLALYDCTDVVSLRKELPALLEVDHRFPQVRWGGDEVHDSFDDDVDLRAKYQLMTRSHNLWKSRYCERCAQTGQRGTFIGIEYFYEGGPNWDHELESDDERGCIGCFWYNPDAWRAALNAFLRIRDARGDGPGATRG